MLFPRTVTRTIARSCLASARMPSSSSFASNALSATRGLVTMMMARGAPRSTAITETINAKARVLACGLKTYRNKPSPKPIKTKSCVKKRFRVSGKGLLKFKRAGLRHNLGCKSPEKRARLNRKGVLRGVWAKKMKKLLLI